MPHAKWARCRRRSWTWSTMLDGVSIWRAIIYHPVNTKALANSIVTHPAWLMNVATDSH